MSPDRIKSIRNQMLLSSILLLIVGVVFIAWPDAAAVFLSRVTAVVILVLGAFNIAIFVFGMKRGHTDIPSILSGVLLMILGIYLLIKPEAMLNFFNIIFGIVILIIGLDHIFQSIFIIRHVRTLWWISLIVGIAAVGLAVITFINPFSAIRTAMILVGIAMVVEAIGGFWNLPALKAKPAVPGADAKPVNTGDEDINA